MSDAGAPTLVTNAPGRVVRFGLRTLLILGALLPMLAYAAWSAIRHFASRPEPFVLANTMVGVAETRIRAEFGPPDQDLLGYQSFAAYRPPSLPPGPIRTLIFTTQAPAHRDGALWVWVVQQQGQWICFESIWYDGVVF